MVLDVKDGSVLAASNYPSFDQNLYATQYSEYSADESLPLFNRALQGLYTPGSTFKPAVAVAALDSGLINQYSTVFCNGVYTFIKGTAPAAPAMATAATSMWSRPSSGAATSFSTMWAAA